MKTLSDIRRHTYVLTAVVAVGFCGSELRAQPSRHEFVRFDSFMERTRAARLENPAHEEMRQHILNTYREVPVTHSFLWGSSHFDCIPVMQQPAAKETGLNNIAAQPPDSVLASPAGEHAGARRGGLLKKLSRGRSADEFGNSLACEEGTVPMRRLTLDEMTRFHSLREYFQKGPNGAGQPAEEGSDEPAATASEAHKYSYMTQTVDNLGGSSTLNIWRPYVDTSKGEVFSLSQEWYVGGTGTSTQTAEVGWQNFPGHYGDQNSRLFIYWTMDGYKTSGCYNMECNMFYQTSSEMPLGADFGDAYSTVGGDQYEFSAEFYLYEGNWWLNVDGTWIGYYPGSIYKGGQLTKHAQKIQFGSESVGTTMYPPEGSGHFSKDGYGQAAYQRNLFYFPTNGDAAWDKLTPQNPSPGCYTVSGQNTSTTSGWSVYFLEGGPGGSGC